MLHSYLVFYLHTSYSLMLALPQKQISLTHQWVTDIRLVISYRNLLLQMPFDNFTNHYYSLYSRDITTACTVETLLQPVQ